MVDNQSADSQARERQHRRWIGDQAGHMREFRKALALQSEYRDMNEGVGSAGGYFVPQQFYEKLTAMMKAVDRLFDPEVVLFMETDNGGPCQLPVVDDTGNTAVNLTEGTQETEADPTLGQQLLPLASLWRAKMVKASIELVQDSGYPLIEVLAKTFAIRLARGIGAANMTQLLSQALVSRIATGSSSNTGGPETGGTTVGSDDLEALVESVDEAYRVSPKCCWLMKQSTRQSIFSVRDKQGRPIYPLHESDRGRTLLGFPIAICPSMPAIGLNAKSIAFGDLGHFVVRVVKNSAVMRAVTERFADYGQLAYQMFLRSNAALAVAGSDSPVKVLQNAAS